MAGGESLGNLYFDLGLDDKEFMSKLESLKKGDFKIKVGVDASGIASTQKQINDLLSVSSKPMTQFSAGKLALASDESTAKIINNSEKTYAYIGKQLAAVDAIKQNSANASVLSAAKVLSVETRAAETSIINAKRKESIETSAAEKSIINAKRVSTESAREELIQQKIRKEIEAIYEIGD